MRFLSTLLFVLLLGATAQAQRVTHGPVVGGVTDTSARVFVRTNTATAFTLDLSTDPGFATVALSVNSATTNQNDTAVIVDVNGLSARTQYYVRVKINNAYSGRTAKFRSFPTVGTPGYYKFIGGSCISNLLDNDTSIFVRARLLDADLFTGYGDIGYPDASTGFNDVYGSLLQPKATSFAANYGRVLQSYKDRYGYNSNINPLMYSTPFNYTWDDHDYQNDNCGSSWAAFYNPLATPLGRPGSRDVVESARANIIKGYANYFPHYPLPDTSKGIYHSFRMGNVEFFVTDDRANRTKNHDALVFNNNTWSLVQPAGHTMLGQQQRQWLLDGLRNSTATWKIIISGVTYSYAQRLALDSCVKVGSGNVPLFSRQLSGLPGGISATGYIGATRFLDKWVGFQADQDSLQNLVSSGAVKNVIIVSGDTHNNGIDDGKNSGIPELMAGQLRTSNRQEAREYQAFMGYNIWNNGGSGLCENENFSSGVGQIEVFGDDSLVASIVDPAGQLIARMVMPKDMPVQFQGLNNLNPNRVPRPANDVATTTAGNAVTVNVLANDTDPENDTLYVILNTLPDNGTVRVNANNTITYTPNAGFSGSDFFTYKACERSNPKCPNCTQANVEITVQGNTSVQDVLDRPVFEAYPNPANERFTIRAVSQPNELFTLRVLSPNGQLVHTQSFVGQANWNTLEVPGGYYVYQLFNTQNQVVKGGRVVVLHK